MFRTHHTRGRQRFLTLNRSKFKRNATLKLTTKQIKLIEETQLLSLGEKIELLLVSMGNKLTTEIYSSIKYEFNKQKKREIANKTSLTNLSVLFKQLPFEFFVDQKEMINKKTGKQQTWIWFQVSVNEAVQRFLKDFGEDLTEYEEGVLYGFPMSAIRAFGGLIEQDETQQNSPAHYFLAGVGSREFSEKEGQYYLDLWNELKKISPVIIDQAEASII
jgi:hypothetical protein